MLKLMDPVWSCLLTSVGSTPSRASIGYILVQYVLQIISPAKECILCMSIVSCAVRVAISPVLKNTVLYLKDSLV